jgi:hypothetical protein
MGLIGPWVISMGPQIQGPSPRTYSAAYKKRSESRATETGSRPVGWPNPKIPSHTGNGTGREKFTGSHRTLYWTACNSLEWEDKEKGWEWILIRQTMGLERPDTQLAGAEEQSVQSVSDCSVSSLVGLFCFSQSVKDYFRVSQSVRIKGISYWSVEI